MCVALKRYLGQFFFLLSHDHHHHQFAALFCPSVDHLSLCGINSIFYTSTDLPIGYIHMLCNVSTLPILDPIQHSMLVLGERRAWAAEMREFGQKDPEIEVDSVTNKVLNISSFSSTKALFFLILQLLSLMELFLNGFISFFSCTDFGG